MSGSTRTCSFFLPVCFVVCSASDAVLLALYNTVWDAFFSLYCSFQKWSVWPKVKVICGWQSLLLLFHLSKSFDDLFRRKRKLLLLKSREIHLLLNAKSTNQNYHFLGCEFLRSFVPSILRSSSTWFYKINKI